MRQLLLSVAAVAAIAVVVLGGTQAKSTRAARGTIMFNSWAMGEPHLWYTVRPDGRDLHVLGMKGPSIDWGLGRLSPDARMFLFDHASSLVIAASNGSHPRVLARAPGNRIASFDWSPDGKRIAYGSPRGISITNVRGSKRVLIVANRGRGIGAGVTWSTRGRWIAFLGRGKLAHEGSGVYFSRIYVVHPDGRGLHSLGDFLTDNLRRCSWSPDDRLLTLLASAHLGGTGFVQVVNARTGARKALTPGYDPQFSPDGRRIAYLGPANGNLRMISSRGGRSWRVGPAAYEFVWSPEGDQIAIAAGSLQLMNADGSRRHQIARARSGDMGREGLMQWTRG